MQIKNRKQAQLVHGCYTIECVWGYILEKEESQFLVSEAVYKTKIIKNQRNFLSKHIRLTGWG